MGLLKRGVKINDVIIFVKSQPHFDVHRQYLDNSLIDLQASVLRFRCRIFHCFVISRKSSLIIIDFIFKKLSAHDFLAFSHLKASFSN